MLQSLRDYKTSTLFFERACETQENIFGKEHAFTATGYHILAKAYTLQGDFKKALEAERVAFDVFSKEVRKKKVISGMPFFIDMLCSWEPTTPRPRKPRCGAMSWPPMLT